MIYYIRDYGNYSKATLENWKTILSFSHKWEFPKVKELAVDYLERYDDHELDPITRINLYQANNLPEASLFQSYIQLARRPEVLTLDESRLLGLETLVRIHDARERLRTQPVPENPYLSPIRTDLGPADIFNIVADTFSITLVDHDVEPKSGT